MATIVITVDSFKLKSSWSYRNRYDQEQDYWFYNPTSPSKAVKTVTIDLSAIPEGSRVISATLSVSTNGAGDSNATCNGITKGITNDHTGQNAIDVKNWFQTLTPSATIAYDFTAYSPPWSSSSATGSKICSVSVSEITIEFEYPNSSGTLSSPTIEAGSSITITISPVNPSYSHTVAWKFYSIEPTPVSLNPGSTTDTWTVPLSACSEIPNSTTGQGQVTLTTFNNGVQVGQPQIYTFTVSVPATVVPTAGSLTATPVTTGAPASWNSVYAQNFSFARMSLPNTQGIYGSTISSVVFSGWGSSVAGTASSNTYTADSPIFTNPGTIELKATVTDSRGMTCVKTCNITVLPYTVPKILNIAVQRGTAQGVPDSIGNNAIVKVQFTIANITGNVADTSSWYQVNRTGDYTNAQQTFVSNTEFTIGNSQLSADASHNIKVIVTDSVGNSATAIATLPTAVYVLHFRNGGKAVGIGQAASTQDNTLVVNPNWTVSIGGYDVAAKIAALDTANVPVSRITGTLGVSQGGTGQTSLADVKTWLGLQDYGKLTSVELSNDEAVTANAAILNSTLPILNGETWEGTVVAGIGSNTNTEFRLFINEDYTTSNYRSYMRYGSSSSTQGTNEVTFANSAAIKAFLRVWISRLADNIFIEGQSLRGNGAIDDFVICTAVDPDDTGISLQLVVSSAVTAGHGSAWKFRKLY